MITVVTGAPCSGKSTYAREHAGAADTVIDFDLIAQALGSHDSHDHPAWLREITAHAWSAAIQSALRCPYDHDAWIVDGYPTQARANAYSRAGARHVHCTAEKQELHRRADADSRPGWTHASIDQLPV